MKNCNRRLLMTCVLGSFLLAGAPARLLAQPVKPPPAATKGAAPAQPPAQPVELSVSPAEQPSPALHYRLMPVSSELNPGDAAPMYLRLRHELDEAAWKEIDEKHDAWSSVPLEKLPIAEARKFVDRWRGRTQLLRIGTRRHFCDWSYPLAEQREDMIGILLPDCQSMRQWARLVSVKARVETAEHAFDQAVDTIETGIAFGRHVGEGPFLINKLVAMSICGVMLERVEELISQPGAPSLYWALTALPRPLVSIREGLETEQRVGESMVPELSLMDESHSRSEWGVLLEKLYFRLRNLTQKVADNDENAKLRSQLDLDLASFKKENLAASQDYLKSIRHMDAERVMAMSEDEVLARTLVGRYRDMRDDYFKLGYLSWRDSRYQIKQAEQRLKSVASGPLAILAEIQPNIMNNLDAQMRLDRKIAALRVVEAIRIYAASHDGKLPGALNEATEVPVPRDPATGMPLAYRRDGAAAVLTLPDAGMTDRPTPSYRINIRK